MNRLFLVVLALLTLATAVASQERGSRAPRRLAVGPDGRLNAAEHGFTIRAPSSDFEWSCFDSPDLVAAYVCSRESPDAAFVVAVANPRPVLLTDRFVAQVLSGMRKSMQREGLRLQDLVEERCDSPLADSARIRGRLVGEDGEHRADFEMRVARTHRHTLVLQAMCPDPGYAKDFEALAASVELTGSKPSYVGSVCFMIVVLCLVALGINAACRRPAINGGLVAMIAVLVLGGLRAVPAIRQGDPEQLGYITADIFVLVAISALPYWWFRRSKQAAQALHG